MSATIKAASKPVEFVDDRVTLSNWLRRNLRKVFPDHWSFLLGEIALYSFIVLLLSGVFLTLWFKPSMQEVIYDGSYVNLRGLPMSEAYASTLEISFDVRGGLLMRQIHHWAALLFIAAMTVHMLRIFFTGAFRRPRELNWLIGIGLLILGYLEGFAGYSLPDDLLSGNGMRIFEATVMLSIPVVGTYISAFVFGGVYPGDDIIARLYALHVLLVPGIMLALVTVHLILIWYQKHTQWRGPGRTEENVVGYPLLPIYTAKAGGFFFVVFGVLAFLGAFMQINPVWLLGPYNPAEVMAGSQPDWYIGFLEGSLRLMPGWEWNIAGFTVMWNVIVPGLIIPGVLFTGLALYPWIEKFATGDNREHHLLDRPRNVPVRTALGVAGMTFYGILWLGGGNDLIATHFHMSINLITWVLRIAVFVLPVVAFIVTKRIALGLQRRDRDRILHGRETGIIRMLPSGEFIEVHAHVDDSEAYALTAHERTEPLALEPPTDEHGIPTPGYRKKRLRAALSRFYYADVVAKPTVEEVEAARAHEHVEHAALEAGTAAGHQPTEVGAAQERSE